MESNFGAMLATFGPPRSAVPQVARMTVSQPSDPHEREADAMASRVANSSGTPAVKPYDFSRVRIHRGPDAAAAARAVDAEAFTVGNHIVFGGSGPDYHSTSGLQLIAHELSHVVQLQNTVSPLLSRQACGHDGQAPRCGFGGGLMELTDIASQTVDKLAVDDIIVEQGLRTEFPGNWSRQIRSPANPVKEGTHSGRVDGMKISATPPNLTGEVVEVKSRSAEGGGCSRATREAQGYVNVLKKISGQIQTISAGLASVGGLRVPTSECKRPKKAEDRAKLKSAGVDLDNPDVADAWCTLNSIQDALNTMFTAPFTNVNFKLNADGDVAKTYRVEPPFIITCPGKKRLPGLQWLVFMVNTKGGVSYGCLRLCGDEAEKEKRKYTQPDVSDQPNDQQTKQLQKPKDQPNQPGVDPGFDRLEVGPDDTSQNVEINPGPEGMQDWQEILLAASVLTSAALLHKSAQVMRQKGDKAGLELAEKTLEKKLLEAEEKGAGEFLKKLDSTRLTHLGEEVYEKEGLKATEAGLEAVAKKSPSFIAKFGPKAAEGLGKVTIVLTIVLLAKDAYAAIDHVSKGGTIELGPSLDTKELKGDTKITNKGPQGPDVSGDVSLNDTQIDIETKGIPNVKGSADITADKLTVKGGATDDGAPVTLNFKAQFQNTTITIKHDGVMKNGNVVSGDVTIKDSEIEIDLPPGATAGRKPGETKTIENVKVRVTSVGQGTGGGTGAGTGVSAPSTANPPTTTQGGQGAPGGQGGQATPASTAQADAIQRQQMITQIEGDKDLKPLFQALLGKEGAIPTREFLERFIQLKALIQRNPKAAEKIIAQAQPGTVNDPVKDIIEPIEKQLLSENQKLADARAKAAAGQTAQGSPGTPATGTQQTTTGAPNPQPKNTTGQGQGQGQGTGTSATGTPGTPSATGQPSADVLTNPFTLTFASIRPQVTFPTQVPLDNDPNGSAPASPPPSLAISVPWVIKQGDGTLEYDIPIILKLAQRVDPTPSGQRWVAVYNVVAPGGAINSTQGDMPIQFSDAGNTGAQARLSLRKK